VSRALPILALALPIFGATAAVQENGSGACPPLSDQVKESVSAYVRKLAKVPVDAPLTLSASTLNEKTCYRRLQFVSSDPSSRITLFLSPDQRFLSQRVFDTRSDPAEEQREEEQRVNSSIQAYLAERKPPALGPSDAPVTIAVFADFQCPFCARGLKVLMGEVLPQYQGRVRVAYLEFPLAGHPWARPAAEAMACVALQSPDLFWKLHDYLFERQPEIRPSNLQAKLDDKIKSWMHPEFDMQAFETCRTSKETSGLVDSDLQFGWSQEITGTPTMFINGHRIDGVSTAGVLKAVIDSQLASAEPQR
jgi:protein-disulfide isomerase